MLKFFTNLLKKDWAIHITVTILSFFVLLTSSGSTMLVILLIRNLFPDFFIQLAPVTLTFIAFISSTIIGTAVSLFIGRHFFRPVDDIIKSQKKVANGDFSAKVAAPKGDTIITDLVNGFNAMTEELGSTEMFRNDFINNFSHEFKTPIVSIKGFAKQLANGNLTDEQKKEYIDIIVNESDRLASMSSNVLLLTKFENQQMVTDKTEFFLDEQIRRIILLMEKQWTKKNIDFDLELNEIKYYSNEEMISHIWLNILNNAIKFTPENGTISVKCFRDDSDVIIKISDTGIGMDETTQKHIFDKFYQGDTSHTGVGNGLGLPLAKRVATLCGGKISVKSETGKGTTFIVRLPEKNKE